MDRNRIHATPELRKLLACRSKRDKIAVPCSCRLAPPWAYPLVSRLVREGYLVWLDRAEVSELRLVCEIYLLTPKGVSLCDSLGIPRR